MRRRTDATRARRRRQAKQEKEAAEREANGGATSRQSSGEVRVAKGARDGDANGGSARTRTTARRLTRARERNERRHIGARASADDVDSVPEWEG